MCKIYHKSTIGKKIEDLVVNYITKEIQINR